MDPHREKRRRAHSDEQKGSLKGRLPGETGKREEKSGA